MSRGLSESLQAPARPSSRSFACQSLPQLQCCCSFRVYRYSWSVSSISGKEAPPFVWICRYASARGHSPRPRQ